MMFRGKVRQIHFVGIGGIGMSRIAEVLLNLGYAVTGSDMKAGASVSASKLRGHCSYWSFSRESRRFGCAGEVDCGGHGKS